ncbi:NADH-quinone oxidoreductase subunit C [Streptomyces sp. NPDC002644]
MSEGWLPEPADALFGEGAEAHEAYEVLTVDVPPESWIQALTVARDRLGCTFFDWLSAVDEPGTGFRVCAHVAALGPVRRLLLRTTVPHDAPLLASAVGVYAGAAWHERETHEMFGVRFDGHPGLEPLLLPEGFEGHPLRKDFVLAARVAKAWPGAKEPGESAAGDHGGPRRRQMLPPGVPDPNEWGPLKGTLPAAPARGAADRPRRTRTATEGSASQGPETPRRSRSAAEGSASQGTEAPRRARSVSGGSASQRGEAAGGVPEAPASGAGPRRSRSVSEGSASQRGEAAATGRPGTAPRSPDAPWHHAKPAFEEPDTPAEGKDTAAGENTTNDNATHDNDERTTDHPEGGGQ